MFKHNGKEEDGCGRGVDSGILSLIKEIRKHAELQSDLIKEVSAVFQSMEGFLNSDKCSTSVSLFMFPLKSCLTAVFPWHFLLSFILTFLHLFFVLPSGPVARFSGKFCSHGKGSAEIDDFTKCFKFQDTCF